MEVVFLVVIADVLIGDPPEFHGLIREVTQLLPPGYTGDAHLATSRPLVLGALCGAVLLPLGAMRSMERLALVNIIGVAANGLLAVLMLTLLAAALVSGQARPLPLWPQWEGLVDSQGGRVGAALVLASTVPIILNCFACHQVGFGLCL
jgi:hypothetical protein